MQVVCSSCTLVLEGDGVIPPSTVFVADLRADPLTRTLPQSRLRCFSYLWLCFSQEQEGTLDGRAFSEIKRNVPLPLFSSPRLGSFQDQWSYLLAQSCDFTPLPPRFLLVIYNRFKFSKRNA